MAYENLAKTLGRFRLFRVHPDKVFLTSMENGLVCPVHVGSFIQAYKGEQPNKQNELVGLADVI